MSQDPFQNRPREQQQRQEPSYQISETTIARTKSYTTHAIGALVLGIFLWLPGLIATILFYNEAKRMERVAGQSLPGVGCLTAMLWFYITGFALIALLVIAIIAAASGS